MTKPPDPASLGPHLPDVYRFALLMTGEAVAAAAVLRRTVEGAVREGVGDIRDARRVRRWLFTEARHQCAQPAVAAAATAPTEPPADPAPETTAANGDHPETPAQLAARFARVPVAERGALLLFYLYLFDSGDLAEVLEIPLAELAPLLSRGRALLGETG